MDYSSDFDEENDDLLIVSALLALNVVQYPPPSQQSHESPKRYVPQSRMPGANARRLGRQMAPIFTEGLPSHTVVVENEPVKLQCTIKCQTSSWTRWEKDGVSISHLDRIVIKEKDKNRRILQIRLVKAMDEGMFTIRVENEYGIAESSTRLTVLRCGASVITPGMAGASGRQRRRRKRRPRAQAMPMLEAGAPQRPLNYSDSTDESDNM